MVLPAPNGWMPLNTLNPRAHGKDKIRIKIPLIQTAFLRSHPNISMEKLKIFSNTAITVDMAAKDIKMKKRVPQRRPPAIWLKIFGNVTNTSPGPSPGLTPKAKHAGKMTRPAAKATKVSKRQILKDSPVKERLPWSQYQDSM